MGKPILLTRKKRCELAWMVSRASKSQVRGRPEALLLKTLEKRLHEALVAEEEAWKKQFEEDVKAGELDKFHKEALKDIRAGKFKALM